MDSMWLDKKYVVKAPIFYLGFTQLSKKVIFGHSAAYRRRWGEVGRPIVMNNKIGIDGAVCPPAKKNLIAVKLPEEVFYFQEAL